MASKLAVTITFKENEKHLYDFLKSRRNQSCFIKDLIESFMNNQPIIQPTASPPIVDSIDKKEESTMNNKKRNLLKNVDAWDEEE